MSFNSFGSILLIKMSVFKHKVTEQLLFQTRQPIDVLQAGDICIYNFYIYLLLQRYLVALLCKIMVKIVLIDCVFQVPLTL